MKSEYYTIFVNKALKHRLTWLSADSNDLCAYERIDDTVGESIPNVIGINAN